MNIAKEMEEYAKLTGVGLSTLGVRALNDPRFYFDVRNGRKPHQATIDKVRAYMAQNIMEKLNGR